jgi:hypothetical protein
MPHTMPDWRAKSPGSVPSSALRVDWGRTKITASRQKKIPALSTAFNSLKSPFHSEKVTFKPAFLTTVPVFQSLVLV